MDYKHKTKEDLQQIWDSSEKLLCKKTNPFYAEIVTPCAESLGVQAGDVLEGSIFRV